MRHKSLKLGANDAEHANADGEQRCDDRDDRFLRAGRRRDGDRLIDISALGRGHVPRYITRQLEFRLFLSGGFHISANCEPPFSWEIAERLRVGDTEALAYVYQVLVVPLTAYLRSQVRDPHVVSDLAQETFVELVRGCRTLTGDSAQIRGWVFRAAQRNAIDHSRYTQRRPERLLEEVPDWPSPERGPECVAADNDEAEQIRLALARLRPDQAQVLTLRFVVGLSAAEVAVVMGKSQGAVRALQHRGAKMLRDDLVLNVARAAPTDVTASSGRRS